jgi:hypothetical protein
MSIYKNPPAMHLALPTAEQLEAFYSLRTSLERSPEAATDEEKKAFCHLVLGVGPGALEPRDIALVQKLCPEEWKLFCDMEWGTPEELRTMEDDNV